MGALTIELRTTTIDLENGCMYTNLLFRTDTSRDLDEPITFFLSEQDGAAQDRRLSAKASPMTPLACMIMGTKEMKASIDLRP